VNTHNTGALWSSDINNSSSAASAMAKRPHNICDEEIEDSDSEE
jgi:hypothetical protein